MVDPVLCADGRSFERSAIAAALAGGDATSPATGLPLPHTELIPNHALRSLIQAAAAQR